MTVLEAPTLAGSRKRAKDISTDLPDDLSGADVILDCRGLVAAAISFVDELVEQVLVVRNADSLRVVNADDTEFVGYLKDRANSHGVSAKVHFDS